MYSFSIVPITNYHKFNGFKTTHIYCLTVLRSEWVDWLSYSGSHKVKIKFLPEGLLWRGSREDFSRLTKVVGRIQFKLLWNWNLHFLAGYWGPFSVSRGCPHPLVHGFLCFQSQQQWLVFSLFISVWPLFLLIC